ncbi:hypothetical protein ECEC1735_0962, partial [Escherichia coli EC1735]
ESMMSAIFH